MDELRKKLDNCIIEAGFNGSVFIAKDNEIVLSKGYGFAVMEHQIPNIPKTVFRIASVTKNFTAAAILKLVEQGLVHLEDTLDLYIPDFQHANEITIHHLLSNSSGIANFDIKMDFYHILHSENILKSLINLIKDKELMFAPGESFYYSISGYLVLQYIIESVSLLDYESFLRQHFFDAIDLQNTGFDFPNKVVNNKAQGYKISEHGTLEYCDFFDMRIAGAGGGLYSTTEDIYRWNLSILNNEILSKQSTDLMFTKHIKADDVNGYGYGIIVAYGEIGNKIRRKYYHPGGGSGVQSFNTIYPDDAIQVILLSNTEDKKSFQKTRVGIDNILFQV